ncbi:MAG: glycosyltransferase family 39 protein [Chloroflexi bacterium]|nr:glycosyltransferase family 39 protein [Chloroflexota bacterium]
MADTQAAPAPLHPASDGSFATMSRSAFGGAWAVRVYIALAGVTFLGLYLRLVKAWEDMRDILAHTAPDDSFYYFEIARNIMHGRGATLDGETVTTGFHPLWLLITLPVFALDDRDLAVHLALTIGAVLGAVTTVLVFAIVHRLVRNPRAALLAAGAFAIHPVIVTYGVSGMETSLTLCTIALFALALIDTWQAPAPRSVRRYALLGGLAGLMMLSRTDTVFSLPAVLVALCVHEAPSMRWRGPVTTAIVAGVVVTPWLIWCLAATGSIVQDSAPAGGYASREIYIAGHADLSDVGRGLHLLRYTFIDDLPSQFWAPYPDSSTPYWFAVVTGVFVIVLLPSSRRGETLRAAGLAVVALLGPIALLAISAGVRWYVARWYFGPIALGVAIAIGLAANYAEGLLDDARSWISRRQMRSGASLRAIPAAPLYVLLYLVLSVVLVRQFRPSNFDGLWYSHPWQTEALDTAVWLNEHTPEDSRVAAYNAGIPAYFADRPVTNIDGVMNRAAYEALRDCRTRDYLREQGIDYVVDSRPMFEIAKCALSLEDDLEVVTEIGSIQPVLVAKVRPAE